MLFEEPPRGALAGASQQVEEVKIGGKLARRAEARAQAAEMDAVDVESAVAVAAGALRQVPVVDQAIDELTQATSTDTDALEIQMILGNLYRQKGQVGRAINVHQALLQRTDTLLFPPGSAFRYGDSG